MYDRFLQFIKKHALIEDGDRMLLAVSGGVDSMALFHLFQQTKNPISVAHCNFQLRDEQSDLDEALVKETCLTQGITFHSIRFGTKGYASKHGISTQMAARDLRFNWFEELCLEHGYTKVALAHHGDDSIETFFLNLARGTSLKGLRGIQPKNGKLIRPLLQFSKEELLNYAKVEGIQWREDASNEESYYKRNLIRHELTPIFQKLNPSFEKVMAETLEKLEARYQTSEKHYEKLRSELIEGEDELRINIDLLKKLCNHPYDAYEILRPFGFNYYTIQDLYQSIKEHSTGKVFRGTNYNLLMDRGYLLLVANIEENQKPSSLILDVADTILAIAGTTYEVSQLKKEEWVLDRNSQNAALDFELLQFPMKMRPWKEGDIFQPLGMKGQKLVSDLLIDLKVSLSDKGKVMVLVSGEKIAWVVGLRISEVFKVTDNTKVIWQARHLD